MEALTKACSIDAIVSTEPMRHDCSALLLKSLALASGAPLQRAAVPGRHLEHLLTPFAFGSSWNPKVNYHHKD